MTDLENLIATALIGTERQPVPALGLEPQLPAENREAALLGAVALVSNYRLAGYSTKRSQATLEPSGNDSKPAMTPAMRDLMQRILNGNQGLLPEYLELLQHAGYRLHHRDLAQFLELGRGNTEYRTRLVNLLDTRGRWLAGLNNTWSWGTGSTESAEDAKASFELGAKSARGLAFQALRAHDPANALTLLESTWKQEAAAERKEFIAHLEIGLSSADEAFLESALSDRSSEVRDTAAELLARLPDSQFNARNLERLRPILRVTKPKTKGALERVKDGLKSALGDSNTKPETAKLEIELPESFDPSWAKDGIVEKAPQSVGQKQWWVQQMMQRATLPMLEQLTGMDGVTLLKSTHKDWMSFINSAISHALKQKPEAELVKRLIAYDIRLVLNASLEAFAVLEPKVLETLVTQRSFTDNNTDLNLLSACQHTWSESFWTQAIEWLAAQATRMKQGKFNNYFHGFSDIIVRSTALPLIPRLLNGHASIPTWTTLLTHYNDPIGEKLKNRWYWEYTQREFRELLSTLQLRLEMHQLMSQAGTKENT